MTHTTKKTKTKKNKKNKKKTKKNKKKQKKQKNKNLFFFLQCVRVLVFIFSFYIKKKYISSCQ